MKTILPLTYLGNIRWFCKLLFSGSVIDIHEHFVKQTYRSRCDILAANGPVSLTVNVRHSPAGDKIAMKDVRLDYSKRWQHQHWQTIVSAYKSSPYFDFYAERFEPYYTRKIEFLLDLNLGLTGEALKILGSESTPVLSEKYIEPAAPGIRGTGENGGSNNENTVDLRMSLTPKKRYFQPDPSFSPAEYWQVFSDRQPFHPDLSIIDLIFCEGPNAMSILRESHREPL